MINQNDQAELFTEVYSSRASSNAKNVHFLFEVAKKELKVTFGKQTVYIRHHQKKNPYI